MPISGNGTFVSPSIFRLISVIQPLQLSVMSNNNRIALQFPDLHLLWKFAQTLTSKSIEIKPPTNVLICDCTKDEINFAVSRYSAKILEGTLTMASR
jgi:hypothetical protein